MDQVLSALMPECVSTEEALKLGHDLEEFDLDAIDFKAEASARTNGNQCIHNSSDASGRGGAAKVTPGPEGTAVKDAAGQAEGSVQGSTPAKQRQWPAPVRLPDGGFEYKLPSSDEEDFWAG